MLGVATLIVVLSVMNGVARRNDQKHHRLEGHVTVYAAGPGGIGDYDDAIRKIVAIPGVVSAIPKAEGQIMVSIVATRQARWPRVWRYDELKQKDLLAGRISAGGMEPLARGEGVLIGKRMAENMGIEVGDDITLISPEGRATVVGPGAACQGIPGGGYIFDRHVRL